MKSRPRIACACALLVAASCGDPLVNSEYRGEPLAAVQGHLTSQSPWQLTEPVRLALVWLRFVDGTASAVVAQPLEYRPVFPCAYRFDLFTPPPQESLHDLSSQGAGNAAEAVLVAFVDRDGDGELTLCPSSGAGASADLVVGASVSNMPQPGRRAYLVFYLEGPAPEKFGEAPQGYSLWGALEGDPLTLLPLSTAVDFELAGASDLPETLCPKPSGLGAALVRSGP